MSVYRILVTGDFIFSSAYDKTARAWLFDTNDLDAGHEAEACIKTFSGHTKGVYPLIFIPAEETVGVEVTTKGEIHPGDILITGSADQTARSWSFETGGCLKVRDIFHAHYHSRFVKKKNDFWQILTINLCILFK